MRRMLVEFVDGSKTMIEMVVECQLPGLVPDVPGMHGRGHTRRAQSVLVPKSHGGVLSKSGCVDYSIGKALPPACSHCETDHPRVLERMIDLKVARGRSFPSCAPTTLTSLECRFRRRRRAPWPADMVPLDHPVAEALTVAKRDLNAGRGWARIGETDTAPGP